MGLLLGKQSGLNTEVCNSVEIFDKSGKVDDAFVIGRLENYKKMYPDLECIGWYQSTKGSFDKPTKDDFVMATDVLSKYCGVNHLVLQLNLTSQTA